MGGSTWNPQPSDTADSVVLKKRKRETEGGQAGRNTTPNRYKTSHFSPRCHNPGKEVFSRHGCSPNLRHRLQPLLAKRLRVEQPEEDQRGPFVPWPISKPEAASDLPPYTTTAHVSPPTSIYTKRWPLLNQHEHRPLSAGSLQGTFRPTHHRDSQNHEKPTVTTSLNPCHICHRRPTTRSVLNAYADCSLCCRRTCYICLRECQGPYCRTLSGSTPRAHARDRDASGGVKSDSIEVVEGRKICSACAVEGVTEYGEDIVWCLHCVEQDREMETG